MTGDRPVHIRAFVAACLDPDLLSKIRAQQEQLESSLGPGQVRWTTAEQLHLTLKFFGNVRTEDVTLLEDALRQAAQGVPPFHLIIRGLGCFPSCRRPNVIWLGLEGDLGGLQRLQNNLHQHCQRFGQHSEDRAFRPHLTIGRVKASVPSACELGERIRSTTLGTIGQWSIHQITLLQSQLTPRGSIYTELAEVAL